MGPQGDKLQQAQQAQHVQTHCCPFLDYSLALPYAMWRCQHALTACSTTSKSGALLSLKSSASGHCSCLRIAHCLTGHPYCLLITHTAHISRTSSIIICLMHDSALMCQTQFARPRNDLSPTWQYCTTSAVCVAALFYERAANHK